MAKHEIREGNLAVSLTNDAYDYNDKLFTLEVTHVCDDDSGQNDADVSGLEVNAYPEEIAIYLAEAMTCAKKRCGDEINVRNVAGYAAQAGVRAVQALALGFKSIAEMESHQDWLNRQSAS